MSLKQREEQTEALSNRIKKNEKRQSEVNRLIKKMYEDNISGKLSDKRLADMLKDYEAEGIGANRTQEVEIYLNYIGKIELPQEEPTELT